MLVLQERVWPFLAVIPATTLAGTRLCALKLSCAHDVNGAAVGRYMPDASRHGGGSTARCGGHPAPWVDFPGRVRLGMNYRGHDSESEVARPGF